MGERQPFYGIANIKRYRNVKAYMLALCLRRRAARQLKSDSILTIALIPSVIVNVNVYVLALCLRRRAARQRKRASVCNDSAYTGRYRNVKAYMLALCLRHWAARR